jgi:hypothetical protein
MKRAALPVVDSTKSLVCARLPSPVSLVDRIAPTTRPEDIRTTAQLNFVSTARLRRSRTAGAGKGIGGMVPGSGAAGRGRAERIPLAGGAPEVVADAGGVRPSALVVDDACVYWTERDGGSVFRARKPPP